MVVPVQDDDDAQNWIPLRDNADTPSRSRQTTASQPEEDIQRPPEKEENRRKKVTGRSQPTDLARIQRKLETSTKLQAEFVDNPIQYFWIRFLYHFCEQAWRLASISTKVGVGFLFVGGTLRMWSLMMNGWYAVLRIVVLCIVFVGSLLYLVPSTPDGHHRALLDMLFHPAVLLESLSDVHHLRFIVLTVLMIPTLLEVRTLGFLTEMVASPDSGGLWMRTGLVSALIWAALGFLRAQRSADPLWQNRQEHLNHIYATLVATLYAAALAVSLWHLRLATVPHLAGPVAWTTGSLLLSLQQHQDWITILSRHALRLALRDTLQRLSQNVQHDEMLQLAMIRWIVDYWSSSTHPKANASPTPENPPQTTSLSAPATASADLNEYPPPDPQTNLRWDEMRTMLEMTTEQMEQETFPPQEEQPSPSPSPQTTNPPHPNTYTFPNASHEDSHDMNDSLWNLKTMLTQMNVDEHARPAVLAYKRAIQEQLPPSRKVSMVFSVCRLSPSMLWVVWRFAVGASLTSPTTAFLLLLPLMTVEVQRVLLWAHSCVTAQQDGTPTTTLPAQVATPPPPGQASPYDELLSIAKTGVDPMTMVLLTFDSRRSAVLLQVWHNVQASVGALEQGLTAAQCLQTTAVAADFAGNLLSLVDFGVQVSQRGLGHGVGILIQEAIVWNSQVRQEEQNRGARAVDNESPPKYTGAVMDAIRNGQLVARNVNQLAQDDGLPPILNALTGVVGRGWLWGHDCPDDDNNAEQNDTDEKNIEESEELTDQEQTQQRQRTEASNESPRNRLSSIMERMAECLEKGLITNEEKDSFLELLTRNDVEEQAIRSVERTVDGLLVHQGEISTEQNLSSGVGSDRNHRIGEEFTPSAKFNNPTELSLEKDETDVVLDTNTSPVLPTRNGVPPSQSHAEEQTPLVATTVSQASSWDVAEPVASEADVAEPVASEAVSSINEAVEQRSSEAATSVESESDEGGGDVMKIFGTTLAVAGAVVGGMALLQRAHNDHEEEERARAQPPEVSIEELNDEDDDNEWVTVSPTR